MAIPDVTGPSEKRSWWARVIALPFWLKFLLTVTLALAVARFCISRGFHNADECAIEYPHDGQCGLVAFGGYAVGIFLGAIILISGTLVAASQAYDRHWEAHGKATIGGRAALSYCAGLLCLILSLSGLRGTWVLIPKPMDIGVGVIGCGLLYLGRLAEEK